VRGEYSFKTIEKLMKIIIFISTITMLLLLYYLFEMKCSNNEIQITLYTIYRYGFTIIMCLEAITILSFRKIFYKNRGKNENKKNKL